jgi:hypothetical protein
MKRISLEIAAILVFTTMVFLCMEFLFRNYRNSVDYIMDDFFEKKNNAEVLLVGNSHALPFYFSLKEEGNQNVGCLTIGGDDLFWMQALVKKYLHGMPRVRYVILNCDDELLGFNQSLSGVKYMNRMLYPYADTMYGNKAMDIMLSKSNFFRSNRDIGYLFNKTAGKKMVIVNAGGTGGFTDEECRARAEEISEKIFRQKVFSENLEYIKSIIAEVNRCHKKLFIIKLPKCDCLEASVRHENLAASHKLLDSLFKASAVGVFDFAGDTSFHRTDFANPDHLFPHSAHRLMQKINERIFASDGERPIHLSE